MVLVSERVFLRCSLLRQKLKGLVEVSYLSLIAMYIQVCGGRTLLHAFSNAHPVALRCSLLQIKAKNFSYPLLPWQTFVLSCCWEKERQSRRSVHLSIFLHVSTTRYDPRFQTGRRTTHASRFHVLDSPLSQHQQLTKDTSFSLPISCLNENRCCSQSQQTGASKECKVSIAREHFFLLDEGQIAFCDCILLNRLLQASSVNCY